MLAVEPDATPEEIAGALYESTWKPDGEDEEAMDTRYGHGNVDARAATDALVDAREGIDTATADGSSETDSSPPSGVLIAGAVAVLALLVGTRTLLGARSLARGIER